MKDKATKREIVGTGHLEVSEPDDAKVTRHGDVIHAKLLVHNAHKMTDAKRRAIANWLIEQAGYLMAEGVDYAPEYTARYLRS